MRAFLRSERPRLRARLLLGLLLIGILGGAALPGGAAAQPGSRGAQPAEEGAEVGYELQLFGWTAAPAGSELLLGGIAYEVHGLAELRATEGLLIEARLTASLPDPGDPRRSSRQEVGRAQARSVAGGRFELRAPLPARALAAPELELLVHRPGRPGRRFVFGVQPEPASALDLLTDRRRYEPGEAIRLWVRARRVEDGRPLPSQPVLLSLYDPNGGLVLEERAASQASGAAIRELTIPTSAPAGAYRVVATLPDDPYHARVEQDVQVWRRTVERLFVELRLAEPMLRPGAELRGEVRARTPSGTPVADAEVQVWIREGSEPLRLRTDAEGNARFSAHAPAFLSGEVGAETVRARVEHPSYGTLQATQSYLLARVEALVAATPSAGGLVPEVEQEVFLHGTDPRGEPLPAGTRLTVTGLGVQGGRAELTLDAHGLAALPMRLPRRAAARAEGGACAGQVATTIEVEAQVAGGRGAATSRLCVPVSPEAQLLVRAASPLARPGATVELELRRRPEAADRPVWVEALQGHRILAFERVGPREGRVRLTFPASARGVVLVRARPLTAEDARRPLDQIGATAAGVGAQTALLVAPQSAFALEVRPSEERYHVRERAPIALSASRPPGRAWAALLARDEAAQGGEGPWALRWLEPALEEAITAPQPEQNALFLRASLAAGLGPDAALPFAPPLDPPPWGYPHPDRTSEEGLLRDPIALREHMIRRGLELYTRLLELAVGAFHEDPASWQGIARRSGGRSSFDPGAIATVVARGSLSPDYARTLGGQPLEVAMITAADPSFTFDNVARRVARARLLTLLRALLAFSDPDNENAQRASANEPPARWLSQLVRLGMVRSQELLDPWGNPFVFRPVAGRQPAVLLSERAVGYELFSAGPDGRYGSADDVRDPRERAVPQGTPYAIASGEDRLMEALARLAPGPSVLSAMLTAYDRVGLAAREEQRATVVNAATSEDNAAPPPPPDAMPRGGDEGGSVWAMPAAQAAGMAGGRYRRSRGEAPGEPEAEESLAMGDLEADRDADGIVDALDEADDDEEQAQTSRGHRASSAMGSLVRERFPATLFFVGEVPLDAQGRATVEVPLADALTTYRLEAIAWSEEGYTTSGSARVRVDQEATVDAPVPPFATVGDALHLPLRVENRGSEPLRVRLEVAIEGGLRLELPEPTVIEVPARGALERVVSLTLGAAGEGALRITASTADGRPLDAVRRPLSVLPEARQVRESRSLLVQSGGGFSLTLPEGASDRGPGQLRVVAGENLFGDPERALSSALWRAWALRMAGRPVPEALAREPLAWTRYEEGQPSRPAFASALALSGLWRERQLLSDADARRTLQAISEGRGQADAALLLVALAPVFRDRALRPALAGSLREALADIRRAASEEGASASEAPGRWARAAAGLALTEEGDHARAQEMLRRTERHLITVGDEAWLEAEPQIDPGPYMGALELAEIGVDGSFEGVLEEHVMPTALLALARTALGEPGRALPLLRHLARLPRPLDADHPGGGLLDVGTGLAPEGGEVVPIPRPRWPEIPLALASAAATGLAGRPAGSVTVLLDGRALPVRASGGVTLASLPEITRSGARRVEVRIEGGGMALAFLDLRYGLPWTSPPQRALAAEAEWSGAAGVRDARAGLLLTVRSRAVRQLARPVLEVDLPAGVELDEPTREALRSHLRADPEIEGRTLRLPLRPLSPAGWERLPLPLRWSVGGRLRGLGVTLYDESDARGTEVRPAYVLPPREVEIADDGEPPTLPEHEAAPPLRPPIRPLPCLFLEGA